MKIQELAWADDHGTRYRIDVTEDGGYRIQAGDDSIQLPDTAGLESLASALEEFTGAAPRSPVTEQAPSPPPTAKTKAASREIDPNFPKKVRNAILIMVGVGIVVLAYDVISRFG